MQNSASAPRSLRQLRDEARRAVAKKVSDEPRRAVAQGAKKRDVHYWEDVDGELSGSLCSFYVRGLGWSQEDAKARVQLLQNGDFTRQVIAESLLTKYQRLPQGWENFLSRPKWCQWRCGTQRLQWVY